MLQQVTAESFIDKVSRRAFDNFAECERSCVDRLIRIEATVVRHPKSG